MTGELKLKRVGPDLYLSPELAAELSGAPPEGSVGSATRPALTLVGRSHPMRELVRCLERAAASDAPVLLEGETGVGKALVAELMHRLGERAPYPFVSIAATALRGERFEAELLGEGEAAAQCTEGLARAARRGTLLVDEVAGLDAPGQAKLRRFLDRQQAPAVGPEPRPLDLRLVCTTHRRLLDEVEQERFRCDLYYRLRVLSLHVPTLRERRDDIPLLVEHFLRRCATALDRPVPTVGAEALEVLTTYPWPGNVRELANEIKRAVVLLEDGRVLDAEALSSHLRAPPEGRPAPVSPLKERSRRLEREVVVRALERNGWNVSATARELDISRVGLSKKMRLLGIDRPRRTEPAPSP